MPLVINCAYPSLITRGSIVNEEKLWWIKKLKKPDIENWQSRMTLFVSTIGDLKIKIIPEFLKS